MGRYISCGIALEINIFRKSSSKIDIQKNKRKILNQLNKMIDTSMYHCIDEDKDGFQLEIKKESFDKNIYELLKSIEDDIDYTYWVFDKSMKKISKEEFEKNPIQLEKRSEDGKIEYYMTYKKEETELYDVGLCNIGEVLLGEKLSEDFKAEIVFGNLWFDSSKILMEFDYNLLYLLNHLTRNHYDTPLWKNCLFFISG